MERRVLAGYEMAGGLWWLYDLAVALPTLGGWRLLLLVPFLVLSALLCAAAVLEFRGHPSARQLSSIAQLAQTPHLATSALSYFFYGPARLTIGLRLEDISILTLFDIGAGYKLTILGRGAEAVLGLNLLPVLILWYVRRLRKRVAAPLTSRGVVVR